MKVYFKDELFDAQLLRAINHMYYNGADFGECLTTAQRITEPDAESWYREWLATAKRVFAEGETSLANGHIVSAREAFLKASNYFRTAYTFLIGTPVDARVIATYDQQREAFRRAALLFSPTFESIGIPYENTTLSGYFFRVDDTDQPRPTLILTGGYDSTAEELYFFSAAAALRRGYNCLCFDGPGQGSALIHQKLTSRPDWENVITPVVDYALTRPDVDPHKVVLMGLSFGGYLAPRAASKEHRLAACIADPGQLDLFEAVKSRMPSFLANQLPDGNPLILTLLNSFMTHTMQHPTNGWGLRRGLWVHGATSPLAYVLLTQEYALQGLVDQIKCPTLVCLADNDEIAAQARTLFDALTCPKQFITFTKAEGAGEHCEDGNRSLFHQRAFDWLDETLQHQKEGYHHCSNQCWHKSTLVGSALSPVISSNSNTSHHAQRTA